MRIIKFISPLVFVTILCICIYSCGSENPIINPVDTSYHFDSARYNWTYDLIPFDDGAFINVPDTNTIYSFVYPRILKDQHGKMEYLTLPQNTTARSINGFDNNHIYISGSNVFAGADKYINRLFKYDGASFSELPFSRDTVGGYQLINGITIVSENELWFRSFSSRIYSFVNSKTHIYDLDSGYVISTNLVSNESGLFVHAIKYIGDQSVSPVDTTRIYKFDGVNFVPVYSEKADNTYGSNYLMCEMNNVIYSPRKDGIYKFTGSAFAKIISPPEHFIFNFGGKNENDYLVRGFSGNDFSKQYISNWNGSKWSKELPPVSSYMSNIFKIDNKYYFALFNYTHTYLYTGRPKN